MENVLVVEYCVTISLSWWIYIQSLLDHSCNVISDIRIDGKLRECGNDMSCLDDLSITKGDFSMKYTRAGINI